MRVVTPIQSLLVLKDNKGMSQKTYTNIIDKLDETNKFLGTRKLPKHTEDEMDKETEIVVLYLLKKSEKIQAQMASLMNSA